MAGRPSMITSAEKRWLLRNAGNNFNSASEKRSNLVCQLMFDVQILSGSTTTQASSTVLPKQKFIHFVDFIHLRNKKQETFNKHAALHFGQSDRKVDVNRPSIRKKVKKEFNSVSPFSRKVPLINDKQVPLSGCLNFAAEKLIKHMLHSCV